MLAIEICRVFMRKTALTRATFEQFCFWPEAAGIRPVVQLPLAMPPLERIEEFPAARISLNCKVPAFIGWHERVSHGAVLVGPQPAAFGLWRGARFQAISRIAKDFLRNVCRASKKGFLIPWNSE